MAKDNWDKSEIASGIAVPIVVLIIGLMITYTDKKNAQLAIQAGHLTSLIEPLSSDTPKKQLIAIEVSSHLAKTDQLPRELLPTLVRLAKESPNSEIALKAGATVEAAAAANSEAKLAVSSAFTGIAPRLYVHIPREDLRKRAEEVTRFIPAAMKDSRLLIPSLELRTGPDKTELRYFKTSEREEALVIQTALKNIGVDAKLVDLSKLYENTTGIRPRHFELWFGTDA